MSGLSFSLLFIAMMAMVAGAMIDLRHRIIPDLLVLIVLASGIALRIVNRDIGYALLAAAILYMAVLYLHRREFIGGGDAKLIVASTLLVPPPGVVFLVLYTVIAGGVLACFYIVARFAVARRPVPAFANAPAQAIGLRGVMQREMARIGAGEPMPYAFAILGGAAFTLYDKVLTCSSAIHCSY